MNEHNERYRYFIEALKYYDLPLNWNLMVDGNRREETNEAAGVRAMQELIDRREAFTAVVAINDLMAFGAISALHNNGVKVPEDVSVIGCDNLEIGRYFLPALSTLDVSTFKLGKYLMRELIAKIEKKSATRKVVISSYVERASVGKCKG